MGAPRASFPRPRISFAPEGSLTLAFHRSKWPLGLFAYIDPGVCARLARESPAPSKSVLAITLDASNTDYFCEWRLKG